MSTRTDWQSAPLVFVTIATCPGCGSTEYLRIRTEAAGDGSFSQKRVCAICSLNYRAVFELPELGNDQTDDC